MPSLTGIMGRLHSRGSGTSGTSGSSDQSGRDRARELAVQEMLLLQQQKELDDQLKEQKTQLDKLQELHSRLEQKMPKAMPAQATTTDLLALALASNDQVSML
mmetsp:Transcript_5994/g.13220  ORF Transcript_5994/g.13220 Transcript_5994/m.13220 type:complete len:103 (-) Transcript_5994:114-422(-)